MSPKSLPLFSFGVLVLFTVHSVFAARTTAPPDLVAIDNTAVVGSCADEGRLVDHPSESAAASQNKPQTNCHLRFPGRTQPSSSHPSPAPNGSPSRLIGVPLAPLPPLPPLPQLSPLPTVTPLSPLPDTPSESPSYVWG